jgi:hypothetical protein
VVPSHTTTKHTTKTKMNTTFTAAALKAKYPHESDQWIENMVWSLNCSDEEYAASLCEPVEYVKTDHIAIKRPVVLDLPTGTKIYTSCGTGLAKNEYAATWNNDDQVLTYGEHHFTSISMFARHMRYIYTTDMTAVGAKMKPVKLTQINGWAVCYVKHNGERVSLATFRITTPKSR